MIPAWLTNTSFACLDLETTGVDPQNDRIVEIGILHTDRGAVAPEAAIWRLNPGVPIPAGASQVHGITDEAVRHAPAFGDIARDVALLLAGRVLVGYNAVPFDWPMLAAEFGRAGLGAPAPAGVLDVLVFIRHFDRYVSGKGRHKLATTAKRWGVPDTGAHSVDGDMRMAWAILWAMVDRHATRPDQTIEQTLAWQEKTIPVQQAAFAEWLARQPPKEAA